MKKSTIFLLIVILLLLTSNIIYFKDPSVLRNLSNSYSDANAPAQTEALPPGLSSIPGTSAGSQSYYGSKSINDMHQINAVTLSLLAKDPASIFSEISNITLQYHGVIQNSSISGDQSTQRIASMTLSIPDQNSQALLHAVHQLDVTVQSEQTTSQDVTANYVDLQARLNAAQAVESQYMQILKNSKAISDVVNVTDKLSSTRSNIESLKGQINLLNNQINYTLITITINPILATVNEKWRPLNDVLSASQFLVDTFKWMVIAGIWLIIYILPLALIFSIIYLIARRFTRKYFD